MYDLMIYDVRFIDRSEKVKKEPLSGDMLSPTYKYRDL